MAKVLLVEDDNNLREIYQARLTAEGYDIIAAQNGEDALVLAKQHHPDLIISDVMMPRISGYEMLDILRNTEELKHTKVIMLTALGQNEDKERAGKLGADKYLVKSQVTLEDIVNSAKALLADNSVGTPQSLTPDPADPLGMGATDQPDDIAIPSVSPIAATLTPISMAVEPTSEVTPVTEAPVAIAPDRELEAQIVPAPEDTAQTTTTEIIATEPVAEPASYEVAETSLLTTETAAPVSDSIQPATDTTAAPVLDPVSVDVLISGDPVATEAVAEVAQAELGSAQTAENEQALVDEQIASFEVPDEATVAEAPSIEAPSIEAPSIEAPSIEAPQVQTGAQAVSSPENDATLNDALQTLTSDTASSAAPSQTVTDPSNDTEPEVVEPHDIEGLSGVTEVVEVPTEPHIDPTPSNTASVIQPVVEHLEPVATLPTQHSPSTEPMTQTVVPTEMPQAPVEEPDTGPDNDGVNVVGKKVIQPLTDPNAKPDLDALLAQEEAKQSGEVLPQPTVGGPTPPAPKTTSGFDPNNIAL